MLLVLFHNACFLNTESRSFYSKHGVYSKHRVTESQSFFLNTKEQRDNVLSAVEDTEAAKAAFTKSTKFSIPAMLCFHPGNALFQSGRLCFHPVGFVATFKSLVIFVSRKKLRFFVSLCLIINSFLCLITQLSEVIIPNV